MLKRIVNIGFGLSALGFVPAVVVAQTATASASTSASARVGKTDANVQSSTTVEAELTAARKRELPEAPIRRRVAEGEAKGASEAQKAEAARKVRLTMEATVEAMAAGGRPHPTDEEIDRGEGMMERGFTKAQVEAVTKSAPSDRSLVVAFDVLTRLNERGVPVGKALAQVTAKLQARQPDVDIQTLLGAQVGAGTGVTKPPGQADAKGTASIGGVIRKP